jgi:hypothetical protein
MKINNYHTFYYSVFGVFGNFIIIDRHSAEFNHFENSDKQVNNNAINNANREIT